MLKAQEINHEATETSKEDLRLIIYTKTRRREDAKKRILFESCGGVYPSGRAEDDGEWRHIALDAVISALFLKIPVRASEDDVMTCRGIKHVHGVLTICPHL